MQQDFFGVKNSKKKKKKKKLVPVLDMTSRRVLDDWNI